MPPKKKSKGQPGIKNGKITLKSTITEAQKKAIEKLGKRINLNGFRWEVGTKEYIQLMVYSLNAP